MLLSYASSSIKYDDIDLIHGKFVVGKTGKFCYDICKDSSIQPSIRIFFNVYGLFGDLTGRFALKCDDLKIPRVTEGILDPSFISKTIPIVTARAIIEEDGFWKNIEVYPWHILLLTEIYNLCRGEYFLCAGLYDGHQMSDRLTWIYRNFGTVARSRLFILNSTAMMNLVKSRNDVLIDADLEHLDRWTEVGGSGFWWPEIAADCKDPSTILSKRLKLLTSAITEMDKLRP